VDDEHLERDVDSGVDPNVDSAVDPDAQQEADADAPFERPVDRFRRGAVGSVVAAGLLGLAEALEGRKKEEAAIVQEAPSPPLREPRRLELLLDPHDPSKSLVFLPERAPERGPERGPERAAESLPEPSRGAASDAEPEAGDD
jgi:hypothetical protein